MVELPAPELDPRRAAWGCIVSVPRPPGGGVRVGEATAAVSPWPYQVRAFERMWERSPQKPLIADEVGPGKTVQAGLLVRQTWLAGRARCILVLAPKKVCRQWQLELREKFNLNWPIYDGQRLAWHPSPALAGENGRAGARDAWNQEPIAIASSHLVRRADRAQELLHAEPWDLVILGEAHHAPRRGAGSASEGGPNALLKLMRDLKDRTQGLVLLTATPMQVHTVEVFDLLNQ